MEGSDGEPVTDTEERIEGERCGRCSNRYAVVWAAENDLWNEVEGGPAGMRCPECFYKDCVAWGIYPFFVCYPEHVNIVELTTARDRERELRAAPGRCSCGHLNESCDLPSRTALSEELKDG